MANIKFTKKTIDKVFVSCKKYVKKMGHQNVKLHVKAHWGLTHKEFMMVYQTADTGDEVSNLDEWYQELHHSVGVNKQYLKNISKNKLKKATILLLAYYHNIIKFQQ